MKLDPEVFHRAISTSGSPKMALDGAKFLLGNSGLYHELFERHSESAWDDASRRNEFIENAALPSEELLLRGKKATPPIILANAERKIQWPDRQTLKEQECRDFAKKMKGSKDVSKELSFLLSGYDEMTISSVMSFLEAT